LHLLSFSCIISYKSYLTEINLEDFKVNKEKFRLFLYFKKKIRLFPTKKQ